MAVTDLNWYLASRHASLPIGEGQHVYRHSRFFIGDGILANANLSAVHATVSRPPQDLILHLPGSIFLFGVRPVNLLRKPVYALDATTIDLCLSVFPWANFRQTKSAIKLHTLLDLRGSIPTFLHISEGKVHDVNILDPLLPEAGTFYVMDRGYRDYARLFALTRAAAFFVIRAKPNLQFRRLYSHPVDNTTGLHCDQTIALTGLYAAQDYPEKLQRITYYDAVSQKTFVFLTNNFTLPALTIADLYRCRWQVELFFKWIKQHLQVKAFYSTSENAVKTKIWIAVSVYVPVANIKERLNIKPSLYTILKSLSVAVFEKMPLIQILTDSDNNEQTPGLPNQLNLFD